MIFNDYTCSNPKFHKCILRLKKIPLDLEHLKGKQNVSRLCQVPAQPQFQAPPQLPSYQATGWWYECHGWWRPQWFLGQWLLGLFASVCFDAYIASIPLSILLEECYCASADTSNAGQMLVIFRKVDLCDFGVGCENGIPGFLSISGYAKCKTCLLEEVWFCEYDFSGNWEICVNFHFPISPSWEN